MLLVGGSFFVPERWRLPAYSSPWTVGVSRLRPMYTSWVMLGRAWPRWSAICRALTVSMEELEGKKAKRRQGAGWGRIDPAE